MRSLPRPISCAAWASSLVSLLVLGGCGDHAVDPDPAMAGDLSVGDLAEPADAGSSDQAGLDLPEADLALITDPCLVPNTGTGIQLASTQIVTHAVQPFAVEGFATSTVYASSATTITVYFNDLVDLADAQTLANYSTGGALTLSGVVASTNKVTLTSAVQTPGQAFTLTVSNVRDVAQAHTVATTAIQLTGYRFGANLPSPASASPGVAAHPVGTIMAVADRAGEVLASRWIRG